MADDGSPPAAGAGERCPLCARPAEQRMRPFCSRRCADIDLGRWLTGAYAVAGGNPDADEDGDEVGEQGERHE
jgi:hypothetical protein